MLKEEFEKLASTSITDEDFKKVTVVYLYHPAVRGKEKLAFLYQNYGGMGIINELYPVAKRMESLEYREKTLNMEMENTTKAYETELMRVVEEQEQIIKRYHITTQKWFKDMQFEKVLTRLLNRLDSKTESKPSSNTTIKVEEDCVYKDKRLAEEVTKILESLNKHRN